MQKIQAIGVQKLVKRQYKDTVIKDGKEIPSQMAGKSYWICTSELGRFTIEDGSTISSAIDSGKLYTITLNKTGDGLEYITHTTTDQEVNFAKTFAVLESIKISAASLSEVENPADLV